MAPPGNGALVNATHRGEMATSAHQSTPSIVPAAKKTNMRCEIDRLSTFVHWPLSFLNKRSLAAAGFYYLNKGDIVRCAYCGVEVGCWEAGDRPLQEHSKWSPNCPFIKSADRNDVSKRIADECGLIKIELRPNSGPENGKKVDMHFLKDLGVNKTCVPKHTQFITLNTRLSSFESWPIQLKPRPEDLADAGFFYTGTGDQTMCFSCGGGLKDWHPTDDPWKEHCKWFSNCSYLQIRKSKKFIETVLSENEPKASAQDILNATGNGESSKSVSSMAAGNHVPKDISGKVGDVRELKELPSEVGNEVKPIGKDQMKDQSRLCKVCYEEDLGVVFLPCGHLVSCVKCAGSLSNCPVCRETLMATVRAYM